MPSQSAVSHRRSMSPSRRRGLLRLAGIVTVLVALGVAIVYRSGSEKAADADVATTGPAEQAIGGVDGGPPPPPSAAPVGGVDVYSHTRAGMLSSAVSGDPALVYVPNLQDGTVTVLDQRTLRVVETYRTGAEPQHVVPSWDLRTLWVNNNRGNSLSPLDPRTGRPSGPTIKVTDPYNLYFTPDGREAMVMAEALHRIDFRDPHTFALHHSLDVGTLCAGVNHADFAPDGSYAIATCEFAGRLVKVDLVHQRVLGYLDLGRETAPQDIKIEPAGGVWYVADMNAAGVHVIDGDTFKKIGFIQTGPETHGLYPSRDGRYLYVANRGGTLMSHSVPFPHRGTAGSVSVIDFATRSVLVNWLIPGGGTPDMGNVNADGSRLWLSGRRSNVVYVFDTGGVGGNNPAAGRLVATIPVGREPHGLAVWPLPGRFSLGHTGILR
jgi:DNA-binding beta-propeller fold protein YncE